MIEADSASCCAGMEAAPDIRTVDYLLDGDSSESFPQSRTMDAHNKGKLESLFLLDETITDPSSVRLAGGHARRLASYIAENIRSEDTLEGYIYATQFVQAEALSTAFSSWRRLFKGGVERAYCSGALVWQLNDVVSSRSADYSFPLARANETSNLVDSGHARAGQSLTTSCDQNLL